MQQTEKAKFVLVGDKGVGKRTLLSYAFGKPGRLSPFYIPIEFVDVQLKTFQKVWNIQCYDSLVSASKATKNEVGVVEGFISQVISGADAVFFCYAADDSSSFRNLNNWYKDVSVHLTPNTLLYLVETKDDLQNRTNEQDFYEFTNNIKFEHHFKVCGLKADATLDMFKKVVEKINSVREINASQLMGRGSAKTSDYSSPEKRKTNGSVQDIRLSDKKEKIILMEGSYVKRFNVVEKTQSDMNSSMKMQPKNLEDENAEEF